MKLGVLEQATSINETAMQKRFAYGLDELAKLMGVSTAFLRKEATANRLKTKKFGARRMVLNDEDLQTYLKGETDEQK